MKTVMILTIVLIPIAIVTIVLLIVLLRRAERTSREIREDFEDAIDNLVDEKTKSSIYQNVFNRLIETLRTHNKLTNEYIANHYLNELNTRLINNVKL